MNHRYKSFANNEAPTCQKYLNKMLKQEATNSVTRKSQGLRSHPEKAGARQFSTPQSQHPKSKPIGRQESPIQKITAQMIQSLQQEQMIGSNTKEPSKSTKDKPKPRSRSRSHSNTRAAWAEILQHKSKEKLSNFSSFDPLRTVNFLSNELAMRLQKLVPDDGEVLQIVSDIQEALKRLPPKMIGDQLRSEDSGFLHKTSTKTCQTPPTLYQEDTERFQKIMEENTYRLEASCKQLEIVCANLQNEKELTEKKLEEARDHIDSLYQKIKNLENQLDEDSLSKIKHLEEEKQRLQQQLDVAFQEVHDNPTLNHLKNLVEELKRQKAESDEMCTRLEYEMTLLKMEKEKFITLLAVRDKEIKEIQDEMSKIQEQVNKQLKKLNNDTLENVNSTRSIPDQLDGMADQLFLEIGDTTISSISTESRQINVIKESPCGDAKLAGMTQESQDDMLKQLQDEHAEVELESTNKEAASLENLITKLTPSIQAMLNSNNL